MYAVEYQDYSMNGLELDEVAPLLLMKVHAPQKKSVTMKPNFYLILHQNVKATKTSYKIAVIIKKNDKKGFIWPHWMKWRSLRSIEREWRALQ